MAWMTGSASLHFSHHDSSDRKQEKNGKDLLEPACEHELLIDRRIQKKPHTPTRRLPPDLELRELAVHSMPSICRMLCEDLAVNGHPLPANRMPRSRGYSL